MSELSIKNVDYLENIELKVKELRPNESVYIIEVIDIDTAINLDRILKDKGINSVICIGEMPKIKELKKYE